MRHLFIVRGEGEESRPKQRAVNFQIWTQNQQFKKEPQFRRLKQKLRQSKQCLEFLNGFHFGAVFLSYETCCVRALRASSSPQSTSRTESIFLKPRTATQKGQQQQLFCSSCSQERKRTLENQQPQRWLCSCPSV